MFFNITIFNIKNILFIVCGFHPACPKNCASCSPDDNDLLVCDSENGCQDGFFEDTALCTGWFLYCFLLKPLSQLTIGINFCVSMELCCVTSLSAKLCHMC